MSISMTGSPSDDSRPTAVKPAFSSTRMLPGIGDRISLVRVELGDVGRDDLSQRNHADDHDRSL